MGVKVARLIQWMLTALVAAILLAPVGMAQADDVKSRSGEPGMGWQFEPIGTSTNGITYNADAVSSPAAVVQVRQTTFGQSSGFEWRCLQHGVARITFTYVEGGVTKSGFWIIDCGMSLGCSDCPHTIPGAPALGKTGAAAAASAMVALGILMARRRPS